MLTWAYSTCLQDIVAHPYTHNVRHALRLPRADVPAIAATVLCMAVKLQHLRMIPEQDGQTSSHLQPASLTLGVTVVAAALHSDSAAAQSVPACCPLSQAAYCGLAAKDR